MTDQPEMHPTPDQEGHYWAKLERAKDPDNNSANWEVVRVFDNIMRPWCEADIEGGECQLVHVPGIERSQPLDAFTWGPQVPMPRALLGVAEMISNEELEKATASGPLGDWSDDVKPTHYIPLPPAPTDGGG